MKNQRKNVRVDVHCHVLLRELRAKNLRSQKKNRGNVWKVASKRKSRTSLNLKFNLNTLYLASISFVIKIYVY